jgi:hypothetical protein
MYVCSVAWYKQLVVKKPFHLMLLTYCLNKSIGVN